MGAPETEQLNERGRSRVEERPLVEAWRNFIHRACLRCCHGKYAWHRRFYRPGVGVVRGGGRVWFVEGGRREEAATLESLARRYSGRVNVLLSGPSARGIRSLARLLESPLVCVNGSPALLGDQLPDYFMYHVNDTGYIRNNPGDFIAYAAKAEWTLVDYRAVYLLLRLGIETLPGTRFVVFDNWGWPFLNAIGEIPLIAGQPRLGEACLSTDPALGLANAGTVAFTAAQALWHWGFEDIYFYGLDLNARGRAYAEAKPQPQRLDKVYTRIIEPAFELLRNETSELPVRFFNCSPDSRLPEAVMPRLDPEASFDR